MAVVYRHRRKDNLEIFYVGIGKNLRRPYRKDERSRWWRSIVNKVDYTVEILAEDLSWKDACELEVLLIKEYGRKDLREGLLCNMTDGGEGATGVSLSKEHKRKIGEAQKRLFPNGNLENLKKAWASTRGKRLSKERIAKISKIVLQYNKNGEFIKEFKSGSEVLRELGIDHVGKVCNNKQKTAGGFIWKYKNK